MEVAGPTGASVMFCVHVCAPIVMLVTADRFNEPFIMVVVPPLRLMVSAAERFTVLLNVTGTLMVRLLVNGNDGSMLMVVFPVSVVLLNV